MWPIVCIHNRFSCTGANCDFSVSTSLIICCNRFAVDGHVTNRHCVHVYLTRPPLSISGVVARSVFSFAGDVILWRFNWQTLVRSHLLAHRTDSEVHWKATFHIGYRLRCVQWSRIHLLQNVELFLLSIPTIKEWILTARFPKLSSKRLHSLEPRIKWQWWHQFCGLKCGFITIHLITMVWQYLKGPQIDGPQWRMLWGFCFVVHTISDTFPFERRFWGSSIDVSFGSAICSDVTNASKAETFFVNFTVPSSFVFAWFMTRFSEDSLSVPDFQAVQFSIFTFHRFVTNSMKVACFITQISHHHWSKTAVTAVDNCHNASFHFCIIREQMLLRCQLFFQVCGAHCEKNSQLRVFKQLFSCAFSMALFQNFPGLDGVREVVILGSFRRRQDLPAVVQTLLTTATGERAADLRLCSKPGSRSASRTISRASPSALENQKCCNS